MTVWLQRGEGRYLELINNSNCALVELYTHQKIPIQNYDLVKHAVAKLDLGPFESEQWGWLQKNAQGRYVREMGYALECLGLAYGPKAEVKIDKYSDFFKPDVKNKIQAFMKSRNYYTPTEVGKDLSNIEYASKKWAHKMQGQALSYGYFCRYIDVIKKLQSQKERISLNDIANTIGPKEFVIKGGGPEFIQGTFKAWGYYLDIFDILTRTGKALENPLEVKIKQLKSCKGLWKSKYDRLTSSKNNLKFKIKLDPANKVRVPHFFRLAINNAWMDLTKWKFILYPFTYENAVRRAVVRTFLLKVFNEHYKKEITLDEIRALVKKTLFDIPHDELIENINYIEYTGVKLERDTKNSQVFKPLRTSDMEDFNYYLPKGDFFKWTI